MTRLAVAAASIALAFHSAGGTPPVFASHSTVRFTLEAPFDELFAADDKDPGASVRGRLLYSAGGRDVVVPDVSIGVRGNTSRKESECTFPKLKLRFDGHPPEDTLFAEVHAIKIGTHCGNAKSDTLTRNGRLPNEKSAHREAFAYRLLDVLGIATLQARAARIEYRDTSRGVAARPAIERDAILLEDDDQARKRLGATRAIDEDEFTSARQAFTLRDTVDVAFGEAALGNFDWCLKFTPDDTYRCDARHPLWNILALEHPGGRTAALPYDFDTSGIVAGRHLWFRDIFNQRFLDTEAAVEVASQLQRTRTLFVRGEIDEARKRFASRKSAVYEALEQADLDPEGVRHARSYLEPFFAAMSDDAAFYLPVVVRPNTQLFTDRAGARAACPNGGAAPIGTPVGPPISEEGGMMQAIALDALWHFTGKNKCPAILNGPVWIDAAAVSADYPRE